jgi:two-component system, OmpR family, sensor histidine kinase CpxA
MRKDTFLRNLKAGVVRMTSRVPMHRLFLKIFFWFWLTAWGVLSVVFLGTRLTGLRVVSAPNMYATVAPILAAEAVRAFESGGPQAFARFSQTNVDDHERQLYLLDGFYRDVLSRPITNDGLRVARAAKNAQLVVLRSHIAAYKFVSSSGHPYILMLYLKSSVREFKDVVLGNGLPFAVSIVFLVTILCFWLAYHIASPIYSIQSAARKVAQGDLKTRVPAPVSKRRDELAALARDFDSMVDRLEVLIRTQKNLLSSVSHELRSPLARINLSIALLRKRSVTESDDLFHRLERDIGRIDLLMGQLLMLSRLEAGLSSGEREDVNFTQLLEEVVADGDFEARSLGKSVTLHAIDSVIVKNADPLALRSACENIIRNAIRFTQESSNVQVVLDLDKSVSEPLAVLSVRDCGPGVPGESLKAIFQPFVQISGDSEPMGGNGLGLAIASEAVRLHGGTIIAANLRPTGLEVTIHLPAGCTS